MSGSWRKMAADVEGIGRRLQQVMEQVQGATARRSKDLPPINPRLVAVSKTKNTVNVLAAYQNGQRHFGENYIKEMEDKSQSDFLLEKCPDIRWHFIGHIQSNKAKKLANLPNLYMVETVHCRKLADSLNNCWQKFQRPGILKVMVQVNTSNEDNKNGCNLEEVQALVCYIRDKCTSLKFVGLMTIGAIGYDPSNGPNPDFLSLLKCREELCVALNLNKEDIELSMGMSSDFEHAIEIGSTSVRVGSTIFGARNYPGNTTTAAAAGDTSKPNTSVGDGVSTTSNSVAVEAASTISSSRAHTTSEQTESSDNNQHVLNVTETLDGLALH